MLIRQATGRSKSNLNFKMTHLLPLTAGVTGTGTTTATAIISLMSTWSRVGSKNACLTRRSVPVAPSRSQSTLEAYAPIVDDLSSDGSGDCRKRGQQEVEYASCTAFHQMYASHGAWAVLEKAKSLTTGGLRAASRRASTNLTDWLKVGVGRHNDVYSIVVVPGADGVTSTGIAVVRVQV
jgi:hypothetical protein